MALGVTVSKSTVSAWSHACLGVVDGLIDGDLGAAVDGDQARDVRVVGRVAAVVHERARVRRRVGDACVPRSE